MYAGVWNHRVEDDPHDGSGCGDDDDLSDGKQLAAWRETSEIAMCQKHGGWARVAIPAPEPCEEDGESDDCARVLQQPVEWDMEGRCDGDWLPEKGPVLHRPRQGVGKGIPYDVGCDAGQDRDQDPNPSLRASKRKRLQRATKPELPSARY